MSSRRRSVLVVEDSSEMCVLIGRVLGTSFDTTTVSSLKEARAKLLQGSLRFDLILLDVNLPDGSGFELCAELRNSIKCRDVPIIFLTARSTPVDKLTGFTLGADDYLVKPFDAFELLARVERRIKDYDLRTENSGSGDVRKVSRDLWLELSSQKAYVSSAQGQTDLRLTPTEFRILFLLASSPDQTLARDKLHALVWGADVHVGSDSLYTHVCTLRKKLGPLGKIVESVPRAGYRLRSEASEPPESAETPASIEAEDGT